MVILLVTPVQHPAYFFILKFSIFCYDFDIIITIERKRQNTEVEEFSFIFIFYLEKDTPAFNVQV